MLRSQLHNCPVVPVIFLAEASGIPKMHMMIVWGFEACPQQQVQRLKGRYFRARNALNICVQEKTFSNSAATVLVAVAAAVN